MNLGDIFQSEKRKLLKILNDSINNDDKHVLFISGDVHHSELIYGNQEYGPFEVTSSGLTHALKSMPELFGLQALISIWITDTYHPYHRTKYSDKNIHNGYYGLNFGLIEILGEKEYNLKIIDALSAEIVINIPLNQGKKTTLKEVLNNMNNDDHIYFPQKYPFYGLEIIGPPLVLIMGVIIYCKWINSKGKPTKDKEV